ncbi:MAG TPA: dihydropteroate synthase [Burkholderiaceae bacterium]|nr:dihydropteroate synthase [Burkholderiaceae bacterium]
MPATPEPVLTCGRFELRLDRPRIMGILNLTDDSFSDGGRWLEPSAAVARALRMVEEGAELLDLGAESTRPGAPPVPAALELGRLLPVLRALEGCGVPLSVDTRKPEVMRAVLDAGADMINDVAGFRTAEAIDAVRGGRAACCVMHMLGEPSTMQRAPVYRDVVGEVAAWLAERTAALQHAGVDRARIVLDPGFGFGKTLEHNLALLARLGETAPPDVPVLVGVSRKSMVGALTGRPVEGRLAGSLAAMLAAVARGARIVRVHDVAETRDALAVWAAVDGAR